MLKQMANGQWIISVSAFTLALVLAYVAGPTFRAGAVRAPAAQTGCKCKVKTLNVTSTVSWSRSPVTNALFAFTITEGADTCASGDPDDLVTVRAFVTREVSWTAVCTKPGSPNINDANKKQKMNIELAPGPDVYTPPCDPATRTSPGWNDNLAGLMAKAATTLKNSLESKHNGYTCTVTITGMFQDDNSVDSFVSSKNTCDGSHDCKISLILYPANTKPRPNTGLKGPETHVCHKDCK